MENLGFHRDDLRIHKSEDGFSGVPVIRISASVGTRMRPHSFGPSCVGLQIQDLRVQGSWERLRGSYIWGGGKGAMHLHAYVCIYVCMYVCMHACMPV